jgi:glutathionyl-hydroquinone reductase
MGLLVDGEWRDAWYETKRAGGHFERVAGLPSVVAGGAA